MPVNKYPFIKNMISGKTEPLRILEKFQAGSVQAIKRGEILKLSGGNFVPLGADEAMANIIAVADEEIKAGDRAGYYWIIVPRPGDCFEFDLAAAGASAIGTALYFSTSQKLTITAGVNVIGHIVGQHHYPERQGHMSDDASGDAGTTIRSTTICQMTFKESASYWGKLQV